MLDFPATILYFADYYRDIARYVPERKMWYVFTGKLWEPDIGNLQTMELCKRLANELVIYALSLPDGRDRNEYRKAVERWQIRHYREIILKDAMGIYPAKLRDFDSKPYLFNCKNGTLDLHNKAFHEHNPADMLATISGVKYDPEACSELWERTIQDVMSSSGNPNSGDIDLSGYLQKALGYGLTGDTSEECFFLLYGPTTRNGKGTVMETYMKMLGGYGKAARPETIALRQNYNASGPSEDIAKLAGARAVNISEPDKQMISVLSAVAEIERENIRVKTMEGRIQKAREGRWNGGFAPYGYHLVDGKLEVSEDEAGAIRVIFDQYVNTTMGANGVSKYLENHGIHKIQRQNGKNPLFDAHLVRMILKNPVYCGKIAYGRRKTEKVHGTRNEYHLVEQDNFLLVDETVVCLG